MTFASLPATAMPSADLQLEFPANPISVRTALQNVFLSLQSGKLSADQKGTLELILAEVLNNIVEHAYASDAGLINVKIHTMPDLVHCEICDQGRPMPDGRPPTGAQRPVNVPIEDLPEGGFGWHLIRSLVEDLTYRREGSLNCLSFSLTL